MPPHLTVEQRQLALRLRARGLSLWQIGPRWAARTRSSGSSSGKRRDGRSGTTAGCPGRGG